MAWALSRESRSAAAHRGRFSRTYGVPTGLRTARIWPYCAACRTAPMSSSTRSGSPLLRVHRRLDPSVSQRGSRRVHRWGRGLHDRPEGKAHGCLARLVVRRLAGLVTPRGRAASGGRALEGPACGLRRFIVWTGASPDEPLSPAQSLGCRVRRQAADRALSHAPRHHLPESWRRPGTRDGVARLVGERHLRGRPTRSLS